MIFALNSAKLQTITKKHANLEALIKENTVAFKDLLVNWYRTETTYSSNALEGNTLTRMETEVVINKDITVGGKTIVEHLEARNHAAAYDFVLAMAAEQKPLTERIILELHCFVLKGIDDANAGKYRNMQVRISGSSTILPNHLKVAALMQKMVGDFAAIEKVVEKALFIHYQLVTVHPFTDGNGRCARLLMNYVLMANNFPPLIIAPKDRLSYLNSLEAAQTKALYNNYTDLMLEWLEASIDFCLEHFAAEED